MDLAKGMIGRSLQLGLLFFYLLVMLSCATQRPILYPNEHLRLVGQEEAEREIDECMRRAEEHLTSGSRASKAAESAAIGAGMGAAVGAAGGAAGGAVAGHAGRGAAVGAAGGGAVGLTRGLFAGLLRSREPEPVYRNFVSRCLRERGYDPIGWK